MIYPCLCTQDGAEQTCPYIHRVHLQQIHHSAKTDVGCKLVMGKSAVKYQGVFSSPHEIRILSKISNRVLVLDVL